MAIPTHEGGWRPVFEDGMSVVVDLRDCTNANPLCVFSWEQAPENLQRLLFEVRHSRKAMKPKLIFREDGAFVHWNNTVIFLR